MIAAALIAGLVATATPTAIEIVTLMDGPLDRWIAADGGVPVTLEDGSTLILFGDTFVGPNDGVTMPSSFAFVNSSAIHIDGSEVDVMYDLLPRTDVSTYYWITDALVESDGSLFVIAAEIVTTQPGDLWGFQYVDTDAFWVANPLALDEWRSAMKIEVGWWDRYESINFADETGEVFGLRDKKTYLVDVETGQEWWVGIDSINIAAPVKHGDTWYISGTCWCPDGSTTTVYAGPGGTGPWTPVRSWQHERGVLAYLSQVHVFNGELVVQWSQNVEELSSETLIRNLRPQYEIVGV